MPEQVSVEQGILSNLWTWGLLSALVMTLSHLFQLIELGVRPKFTVLPLASLFTQLANPQDIRAPSCTGIHRGCIWWALNLGGDSHFAITSLCLPLPPIFPNLIYLSYYHLMHIDRGWWLEDSFIWDECECWLMNCKGKQLLFVLLCQSLLHPWWDLNLLGNDSGNTASSALPISLAGGSSAGAHRCDFTNAVTEKGEAGHTAWSPKVKGALIFPERRCW